MFTCDQPMFIEPPRDIISSTTRLRNGKVREYSVDVRDVLRIVSVYLELMSTISFTGAPLQNDLQTTITENNFKCNIKHIYR